MGVVYLAHDERLERDVALKVLPQGTLEDEAARKRFRREALTLSKLNHPNIATIFDFDSADVTDFLVTEYVPGATLDSKIALGPLPQREVLALGIQLAQGLEAAHAQGVVHRDLKPANLRLTTDGRLKILDFGLAQLAQPEQEIGKTASMTASQQITGTLPYMAPEQLRGEPTDARSDIWALGAVLYELATAKRPFPETHGPLLIDSILNREPEMPSRVNSQISPGLENVIRKALAKNPAERYQFVRELRADLERLTAGAEIQAQPGKRSTWLMIGVALGVIGLIAAGSWLLHRRRLSVSVTPVNTRLSVAVLGFKNLSGRSDTAWLSTALSEMLTTELAAGEKLLTISGENVARVKNDLSLPETDTLAADTLARVRKNLGTDYVVLGSYFDLGSNTEGQIRLDLRLQEAASGQTIAVVSDKGTESELDDLVTRAGARLREKLGAGEVPSNLEVVVRATRPANLESARLYAEGLEKLRTYDALVARDLLLKAIAADPQHVPSRVALAAAWSALGYDAKAAETAKQAFDLSGKLPRDERLEVQGQYYESSNQNAKAIAAFETLFEASPDNPDFGLKLASAQISGSKANDALTTIAKLRQLPSPQRDDLRIDLTEAHAAQVLSDFNRQNALAARVAEQGQKQGAKFLVARAQMAQCSALRNLGDPKAAIPFCESAQQISLSAGDRFGVAQALNNIGNALYDLGDLEKAKTTYEQVAQIDQEIGNLGGLAGALDNRASVVGDQGDGATAKKLSEQALAIYRITGDKINIAATLNNIAAQLVSEGDLRASRDKFEESLAIGREIGSDTAVATALTNLGEMKLHLGDPEGARNAYEESLATFQKNGEKMKAAYPMVGLGDVLLITGNLEQAKSNYTQGLAASQEAGEKHEAAIAMSGLGNVRFEQADLVGARKQFEEALALRTQLGEKDSVADSQIDLARVELEENQAADAEAKLRGVLAALQPGKVGDQEALARILLARALMAQGKTVGARSEASRSLALAAKTQHRGVALDVKIGAASITQAGIPLDQALAEAVKINFVNHELEAGLALGIVEIKTGKAAGRARLDALERDARAKGFVRIAERAAKARG